MARVSHDTSFHLDLRFWLVQAAYTRLLILPILRLLTAPTTDSYAELIILHMTQANTWCFTMDCYRIVSAVEVNFERSNLYRDRLVIMLNENAFLSRCD